MRKSKTPSQRKVTSLRKRFREEKSSTARIYPFCAIVGQEEMKLALLLNAIDPLIGGVLIMGHRGTGKSTAVRGLAALLPEMWVVRNCFYRCDPNETEKLCPECKLKFGAGEQLQRERVAAAVVELPLGATEDRVCGTIDIERALKSGTKVFEPGLLARANRGFLYIDEVNLLEDHLVDLLLDAAATGRNRVEREGVSVEHPARFVLIGSGNPEEGELRPQLQDRFGFHIEITTDNNLDSRVAVVEKRQAFDRDPKGFLLAANSEQERLRRQIIRAQNNFNSIKDDPLLLQKIAELCSDLQVDGHRGELTIARAARALAALEGRRRMTSEDVKRVAVISLRHRLRRNALDEAPGARLIEEALERVFPTTASAKNGIAGSGREWPPDGTAEINKPISSEIGSRVAKARIERSTGPEGKIGTEGAVKLAGSAEAFGSQIPAFKTNGVHSSREHRSGQKLRTRRQKTQKSSLNRHGGRYRQSSCSKSERVALDATLRAAVASWLPDRRGLGDAHLKLIPETPLRVPSHALRYKLFARKNGSLFIFAIDTSGSMALNRIHLARGALLQLLKTSYVNRDHVAIVTFGGATAKALLPPSRSMLRARGVLDCLTVGGGTPLAAGLACSLDTVKRVSAQGHAEIILLLFTDGRANVSLRNCGLPNREREQLIRDEIKALGAQLSRAGVTTVVVETRDRFFSGDEARELAKALSAQLVQINCRPKLASG